MNVLRVWKVYFSVFCKFLNDEIKTVIWEGESKRLKLFKSNIGDKNFLEKGFEVALSPKTIVLILSKRLFWVFCKFFSDEVKTVFWESDRKRSKLLNSKFDHKELLWKWCWSYLELKNEFSERLKAAFFCFFPKLFSNEVKAVFLKSEAKCSKLFKSKIDHTKLLRKWLSNYLEIKNECFGHLKRVFLSGFPTFECRSWNRFLGKQEKAFRTT